MKKIRVYAAIIAALAMLSGLSAEVKAEKIPSAPTDTDWSVDFENVENWPDSPEIEAQAAILMEANTGAILYCKNHHEKMFPASTTKMLTALLTVENSPNIKEMVTISRNAVSMVPRDGSNIGIDPGQSLTVEECLYGIMVASANEVSNGLAEYVAGDINSFAELMNARAKQVGCTDSHFANPTGLPDDDHYTSAYDLALIAREYFQNEMLVHVGGTGRYHFEATDTQPDDFFVKNKHKLINGEMKYDGIIGGKTGYTDAAGQTLVTCAERGNMKLICVVMKEVDPMQFEDTARLFDYGFSSFRMDNPSDSETDYVTDSTTLFDMGFDIFGSSAPMLAFNSRDSIVLPLNVSRQDAHSRLIFQEDSGDGSIAKIVYSYSGIYLGSMSVDFNSAWNAGDKRDEAEEKGFILKRLVSSIWEQESRDGKMILYFNVKLFLITLLSIYGAIFVLIYLNALLRSYSFVKQDRRKGRGKQKDRKNKKQELHF